MTIRFNLSQLERAIPRTRQRMDQKVLDVTKKVTLDAYRNIVLGSPVDTGEFRAAWTVETPSKPYDSGRIENPTVYGPQLRYGSSDQAPSGWIETALADAAKGVNDA